MFRGSVQTRVDEKNRLKMPADYKRELAEEQVFYITSQDGKRAQLYPMAVWEKKEQALKKMPISHPARVRFLDVTSYYGQTVQMDGQGRLTLPQTIREAAELNGDVMVLGQQEILEVVNLELFKPKVAPLTDAEMSAIAEYEQSSMEQ